MKLERLTIISLVLPFLIPFLPGTEARSDVAPLQLCLGAAADYSPVYPTNTFPSNTQELTAVFHQSKTEAHKKLSGAWIAVNVGNAAPPNYVIAKTDLAEEQGMDRGRFRVTLPKPFPPGKYRLEVTEDGKPWQSADFTIAASDKNVTLQKPEEIIPLKQGKAWIYSFVQEAGQGITITEAPPGATLGADGKLRATVTFTVVGTDKMGTHIEMRRGNALYSEEWWQVGEKGFAATQRRMGGQLVGLNPLQVYLPWPLKSPQMWEVEVKEASTKQVHSMWGPIPVKGPNGEEPGYVVVVGEPPRSIESPIRITVERHFLPGVGIARTVFVTANEDTMVNREELVLK